MFFHCLLLSSLTVVSAGPVTESYKDQYCTDPRTMQKHAAYTEWADAYSCTRHRCQPGGRNLAIYTVGCKRVEAPESAIECEEVVEDTNMQFPFCCTRLRCLVVVRGEVWTRVLGQPWEALPAAPWSHMYKMKKPPPPNGTLASKSISVGNQGPVYELSADTEGHAEGQKVLRASKKTTEAPDCDNTPKSAPIPDIVIALATESESKGHKKNELRHKLRKTSSVLNSISDDEISDKELHNEDFEDAVIITEKIPDVSEEKVNTNAVTRKTAMKAHHEAAWTEIPQKEWNEQDPVADNEDGLKDLGNESQLSDDEKGRPALQALVDAIGTRMRDIENVVQKMSEKVHQVKPGDSDNSFEKQVQSDAEILPTHGHHKSEVNDHANSKDGGTKPKQPGPDAEHYKRFADRNKVSKYLRSATDVTSEPPLFVEDAHLNGYFSDASNSVLRRSNSPKEPAQYMAPVETRRKTHILSDGSDENRKHKKHFHKKGKSHKKHHGRDKRKRFNRLSSAEVDKNVVSLEDSSAIVNS